MGLSKWTKLDVDDTTKDATPTNQTESDDHKPLVVQPESSSVEESTPSVFQKKPLAVWAIGGVGGLFLIVVILIIRGSTVPLHTSTVEWLETLPSDMKRHINRHIDPCDDFYTFSCGAWTQSTPIPDDQTSVSLTFQAVHDANELVLKHLMEQQWPIVGELYASCMNFTSNNTSTVEADQVSVAVLRPVLDQITAVDTKEGLFALAGSLSKRGPDFLTGFSVSADARNATVYVLYASQTGLSLPDPAYYVNATQYNALHDAFHVYIQTLFHLTGYNETTAQVLASMVVQFEHQVALFYVPKEELQDPVATYNRVPVSQALETYPLTFFHMLNGSGILPSLLDQSNASIIIQTPAFFDHVEAFVASANVTLETLKAVLVFQYLHMYASALSEPFVEANFVFFGRILRGQATRAPRWKVCLQRVRDKLPDLVGKYYAMLQFDAESDALAHQLVTTMQTTFETTLQHVTWLDEATQKAATTKLHAMTTLLGASTRSNHVPYEIFPDAPLVENLQTIETHEFTRVVSKLGHPVDRTEWAMTSADVNAYYQAKANQIVFPAGILQPPFFNKAQPSARNFGSIGSIIGHELTHGFDAMGRQYAANGTLSDWWSNATASEFSKRTQCLVEQYGRYSVSSPATPDKILGHVNGQYTLSENIADNGGVKLAYQAYRASTPSTTRDERMFFVAFAQTFCAKKRDQVLTENLASDPHTPEQWRINGVASNSPDFARVFACPVTARMNPTTKCSVW